KALYALKKYNYKAIYKSPRLKVNHKRIEKGFEILFDYFLEARRDNNTKSQIFTHFLNSKLDEYKRNNSDELKVRDFLAGMTDRYFSRVLEEAIVPQMTDFKIWNE
ncbi:MAG: dGTP triphosphohydrolase, partial [Calditrichaceae bacterium]